MRTGWCFVDVVVGGLKVQKGSDGFETSQLYRVLTPRFVRDELVLILQMLEQVVGRSEDRGVLVLNKDTRVTA